MPRMATMPLPSPCRPWQGQQKMAKRSLPRSSKSSVRGTGKAFESFGTMRASVSSEPRATVFSIAGRADRPSGKKAVGESGFWRGWLAMSWRSVLSPQAATKEAKSTSTRGIASEERLFFIVHLADMLGVDSLQETCGLAQIELGIASLDAEKETIGGSRCEAVDIEDRMIRLRQLVQGQHADNRKNRSAKDRQFEGDGDEGRPTVERTATNVLGISDDGDPVLQTESRQSSPEAANEGYERNPRTSRTDGFGKTLDWKRSISVDALVAGFARFFSGRQELLRRFEFAHEPVKVRAMFGHEGCSRASPSWTNSRISAMAIAGKPRTNRKTSIVKRPKIVPARVA